jgi:hypothetical protein
VPDYLAQLSKKTRDVIWVIAFICLAVIPSLYLSLLTFLALWIGLVQFYFLRPGQVPDPQFLVLGILGAVGLCGLWFLVLVPTERLRQFKRLRFAATAASVIGMMVALIFLSGTSLYGWHFNPHKDARSVYILGAPILFALVRLINVGDPYRQALPADHLQFRSNEAILSVILLCQS